MADVYSVDELIENLKNLAWQCPGPDQDPSLIQLQVTLTKWRFANYARLGSGAHNMIDIDAEVLLLRKGAISDYAFAQEVRRLYARPPRELSKWEIWKPRLRKASKIVGGVIGFLLFLFIVTGGLSVWLGKAGTIFGIIVLVFVVAMILYGALWPRLKGSWLDTKLLINGIAGDQYAASKGAVYRGMKCPYCGSYLTVGRLSSVFGDKPSIDEDALKYGVIKCKKCGRTVKS